MRRRPGHLRQERRQQESGANQRETNPASTVLPERRDRSGVRERESENRHGDSRWRTPGAVAAVGPVALEANPSAVCAPSAAPQPPASRHFARSMQAPPVQQQGQSLAGSQGDKLPGRTGAQALYPQREQASLLSHPEREPVQAARPPRHGTHCHRHRACLGPPGWQHPASCGHCPHLYPAESNGMP